MMPVPGSCQLALRPVLGSVSQGTRPQGPLGRGWFLQLSVAPDEVCGAKTPDGVGKILLLGWMWSMG